MENINVRTFMDTLSDEVREKVMACRTSEELEAVFNAEGIDLDAFCEVEEDRELSLDDLENVSGGRGFIPSALVAIIMFTSAAPVLSSADIVKVDESINVVVKLKNDENAVIRKAVSGLKRNTNVVGDYNGHDLMFYRIRVSDDCALNMFYSDGIFEDDFTIYNEHMASVSMTMTHASCMKTCLSTQHDL